MLYSEYNQNYNWNYSNNVYSQLKIHLNPMNKVGFSILWLRKRLVYEFKGTLHEIWSGTYVIFLYTSVDLTYVPLQISCRVPLIWLQFINAIYTSIYLFNIQNNCILIDCFFAIHIICTFLMYWFEHKNYH